MTDDTAANVTAEGAPKVTVAKPLNKPLPQHVILTFPYHVRADRPMETKAGKKVRRVVMEFLDGKAGEAITSLKASMKAAGFTASPVVSKTKGVRFVAFRKEGYGRVQVWVSAHRELETLHEQAKGTIRLDWPA